MATSISYGGVVILTNEAPNDHIPKYQRLTVTTLLRPTNPVPSSKISNPYYMFLNRFFLDSESIRTLRGVKADTATSLLAYVNPYYSYDDFVVNKAFDIRQPEAQQFMERWCRTLQESELVQKVKPNSCVISEFRSHVEQTSGLLNANGQKIMYPVPAKDFDRTFESFMGSNRGKELMKAGLVGFERKDQCRLMFMVDPKP